MFNRLTRQEWYGAMVAVLVLASLLSVASPYFLTTGNLTNILVQASVIALLAGGQTFVILTGGVDLAVGAVTALAGALCGYWMVKLGVNPYLAMAGALVIGLASMCMMLALIKSLMLSGRLNPVWC